MKCAFSSAFLVEFPTVAQLLSTRCLATLTLLAILLRIDITRQECRHASIQRALRKSQTHKADLCQVSAGWLLLRHRRLHQFFHGCMSTKGRSAKAKAKASAKAKVRRRRSGNYKGARAGGGGARRRAVGIHLSGASMQTPEERRAAFAHANAKATEMREKGERSGHRS